MSENRLSLGTGGRRIARRQGNIVCAAVDQVEQKRSSKMYARKMNEWMDE